MTVGAVSPMSTCGVQFKPNTSSPCLLQEYQDGAKELVISDTEPKQVVYAFHCNNSTLQVKGKVNAITIGEDGGAVLGFS